MKVLQKLILPTEVTDFERRYVQRLNRLALIACWVHLPVFVLIAWLNDTGPVEAAVLTLVVLAGPTAAFRTLQSPRWVGIVYGITSMFLGGLLVHFGQGPVQIEMHFYFFAMLAILAVYGNPMVIVSAAVTVAIHHAVLWVFLPSSVFNYDAPWWVVGVHAGFVVGESIITTSMARSFFDNVIGLEKIVQARTAALDARNDQMRVLMDNVNQGLLTVSTDGIVGPEYSAAATKWLPELTAGCALGTVVRSHDPDVADYFELGLEQICEDCFPLEVCLDQMPTRLVVGERYLKLDYQPIGADGELRHLLVVISDVTDEVERERVERRSRETMAIFEHVLRDKAGFLEFFSEAERIVDALRSEEVSELHVYKRLVHTLKGTASIFHITTVADRCHELESYVEETESWPSREATQALLDAWHALKSNLDRLLGDAQAHRIELDDVEFCDLLSDVLTGATYDQIADRISRWKLEPTGVRLQRIARQAQGLAMRLDKGDLDVEVDSQDLLLEPRRWSRFWAGFSHAVRNAIDHGIEPAEERTKAGKKPTGRVSLRTVRRNDRFVVEIADDGRGVDWQRVRERAMTAGLEVGSTEDLKEVLFTDGFSTRTTVSEYSGRGVGMAVLKEATEELGGQVSIDSDLGAGTTIRFDFPLDAMAPQPRQLLEQMRFDGGALGAADTPSEAEASTA